MEIFTLIRFTLLMYRKLTVSLFNSVVIILDNQDAVTRIYYTAANFIYYKKNKFLNRDTKL